MSTGIEPVNNGAPVQLYRQYARAERSTALMLGISSHAAQANAERAARGRLVLEGQLTVMDAAYRAARWPEEPDVPEPFGLSLLLTHEGDIRATLADERMREILAASLGLMPREVHDGEGGWTRTDDLSQTPEGQHEIDSALVVLRFETMQFADENRRDLSGARKGMNQTIELTDEQAKYLKIVLANGASEGEAFEERVLEDGSEHWDYEWPADEIAEAKQHAAIAVSILALLGVAERQPDEFDAGYRLRFLHDIGHFDDMPDEWCCRSCENDRSRDTEQAPF